MKNSITANMLNNWLDEFVSLHRSHFNELLEEYNLNPELNDIMIYSVNKDIIDHPDYADIIANKHRYFTISKFYTDNDSDSDDECILDRVVSHTMVPIQSIYETIIGCMMDTDAIQRSIKFSVRHEVGHIICNQSFIGMTVNEYNEALNHSGSGYNAFPKLRKNASMDTRLKAILDYYHLPSEQAANDAVGITDNDIICEFKLTHGF